MNFIEWNQRPVGHGGFHTGVARTTLDDGESRFCWVFDCGSRGAKGLGKALKREIDGWVRETPETIDWLFISHFDLDHVSGLDALFARRKVREVMLPYVNEHELIHALCEAVMGLGAPAWFVDFLENPAAWLADRGVSRVVFLGEREGPDRLVEPDDERRPEGFGRSGSWTSKLTPTPRQIDQIANTMIAVADGGTCTVVASDGRLDLRLEPYRAPTPPFRHLFLLAALQKITGWNLPPQTSGSPPGLGGLAKAITRKARSPTGRQKIQKAYALGVGTSNRSSLSLLSVPEWVGPAGGHFLWALARGGVWEPSFAIRPPAWVNTGDAELLAAGDLADWAACYAAWIDRVEVLALPHHGSDHNSGGGFQSLNSRTLLTAHVSKNASKHPGPTTSANAGSRLVKVTDEADAGIAMFFAW